MELHLSLHVSVVAIEKGAFQAPTTMVANFTLFTSWEELWTIPKIDKEAIQTNGQKDEETDDYSFGFTLERWNRQIILI